MMPAFKVEKNAMIELFDKIFAVCLIVASFLKSEKETCMTNSATLICVETFSHFMIFVDIISFRKIRRWILSSLHQYSTKSTCTIFCCSTLQSFSRYYRLQSLAPKPKAITSNTVHDDPWNPRQNIAEIVALVGWSCTKRHMLAYCVGWTEHVPSPVGIVH